MNKRILLFAASVTISASISSYATLASELRPLSEVLAEETSPAIISYAFKRCSAAYIAMSALMMIDGGDTTLSAGAQEMSSFFFELTMSHSEREALALVADSTMTTIFDMSSLYTAAMQANYLATGNRLEGTVREDIEICRAVWDSSQSQ